MRPFFPPHAWKGMGIQNGDQMIIDPFSRKVIHFTGPARSFQVNIADESVEDLIKSANVALRLASGLTRLARRAGDINIF